jgi:hypothetical protein
MTKGPQHRSSLFCLRLTAFDTVVRRLAFHFVGSGQWVNLNFVAPLSDAESVDQ